MMWQKSWIYNYVFNMISSLLKNIHMYVGEIFFTFLCTFRIFYNEHQLTLVRELKCELNNDEHFPPQQSAKN